MPPLGTQWATFFAQTYNHPFYIRGDRVNDALVNGKTNDRYIEISSVAVTSMLLCALTTDLTYLVDMTPYKRLYSE